jgi:biotin carboxyl carrier protein
VSEDGSGPVTGRVGEAEGRGLEALTEEILPALIARLRASRLGELEVRSDGWRVRLRRDLAAAARARTGAAAAEGGAHAEAPDASVATSPAVGYFSPAPTLAVGLSVQAGDVLGSVDVLGIAQEVVAPSDGMVTGILAEDGQAVEYGQVLADIDPLEVELDEEAGMFRDDPVEGDMA